jgi:hypothetical protein
MKNEGLADAKAANPFRLSRPHPGIQLSDKTPRATRTASTRYPLLNSGLERGRSSVTTGAPKTSSPTLQAVREGTRVFSAYELLDATGIWIITEADRSATTILLPEEY